MRSSGRSETGQQGGIFAWSYAFSQCCTWSASIWPARYRLDGKRGKGTSRSWHAYSSDRKRRASCSQRGDRYVIAVLSILATLCRAVLCSAVQPCLLDVRAPLCHLRMSSTHVNVSPSRAHVCVRSSHRGLQDEATTATSVQTGTDKRIALNRADAAAVHCSCCPLLLRLLRLLTGGGDLTGRVG